MGDKNKYFKLKKRNWFVVGGTGLKLVRKMKEDTINIYFLNFRNLCYWRLLLLRAQLRH